jgi:hypothetical protein
MSDDREKQQQLELKLEWARGKAVNARRLGVDDTKFVFASYEVWTELERISLDTRHQTK